MSGTWVRQFEWLKRKLRGFRSLVKQSLSLRPWVSQVVKPAILGAADEIGNAIVVEVHRRRADIVAFDVLLHKGAEVAKEETSIPCVGLAEQVCIDRVHQHIELSVTIPICHADLTATTPAGDAVVQSYPTFRLLNDCVAAVGDGKILTEGPSEKLLNDPEARRVYLGEKFRI